MKNNIQINDFINKRIIKIHNVMSYIKVLDNIKTDILNKPFSSIIDIYILNKKISKIAIDQFKITDFELINKYISYELSIYDLFNALLEQHNKHSTFNLKLYFKILHKYKIFLKTQRYNNLRKDKYYKDTIIIKNSIEKTLMIIKQYSD